MKNIRLPREVQRRGKFYRERYFLLPEYDGSNSRSRFLELRSFGTSRFFPGGRFAMGCGYWVFQLQIENGASVQTADSTLPLQPHDLLVLPPGTKYVYTVPAAAPEMRKYFLIFQRCSLLELLLRDVIEQNGFLIRNPEGDFLPLFERILDTVRNSEAEERSMLLYQLLFRIHAALASAPGDFQRQLQDAANRIDLSSSLSTLSQEFQLPKHTLIRKFRRDLGTTPVHYIISLRLGHARQLLEFSDLSIAEVAESCGYRSPSFFSSEFRRHFGSTPGAFRKISRSEH